MFSSIMYSCFYTVKHDVGNRNLGFYGAKSQENVKKLDSACSVVTMCLLLCYISALRQTVYVKCIPWLAGVGGLFPEVRLCAHLSADTRKGSN